MNPLNIIPDLILHKGAFYTQDFREPKVEAVAIGGDRILAVGDNQDIRALGSNKTIYYNMEGRIGLPGMMDSHFHYHEWSFMRRQINLAAVSSFVDCTTCLKYARDETAKGDWILGQGFNESDWPVGDPGPLVGIHAAVTRQRNDGTPQDGWYPEQRVSVTEAVHAYTLTPAIMAGVGDLLGSITPGKYADLIVLNQDFFSIDPAEILNTKVHLTLFDGKIVHQI